MSDQTIYRWYLPNRGSTAHAQVNHGPGKGEIACCKHVGYGRTVYATADQILKEHNRNPCHHCLINSGRIEQCEAHANDQ